MTDENFHAPTGIIEHTYYYLQKIGSVLMSKLKKHPIFDIQKVKNFDKNIPQAELYAVLDRELEDVILALKKSKKTKISKQLKKYIIIRLVTIVEIYLQNIVSKLIDKYDLDASDLFQGSEIPIPIKNFKEIQGKDFTKGKIIAINFNFQNFQETNRVFSQILGIDFFETLKDWIVFGIQQETIPESEIHLVENWDDFQDMFSLRNEIVHTLQTPYKIRKDAEYFERLWDTVWHFINCVYNLSEDVILYKRGKIKNKSAIMCLDKVIKKRNSK